MYDYHRSRVMDRGPMSEVQYAKGPRSKVLSPLISQVFADIPDLRGIMERTQKTRERFW